MNLVNILVIWLLVGGSFGKQTAQTTVSPNSKSQRHTTGRENCISAVSIDRCPASCCIRRFIVGNFPTLWSHTKRVQIPGRGVTTINEGTGCAIFGVPFFQ